MRFCPFLVAVCALCAGVLLPGGCTEKSEDAPPQESERQERTVMPGEGSTIGKEYPSGPYGTEPNAVIADLSFQAGNDAAAALAGEPDKLSLRDFYRQGSDNGGSLKGLLIFLTAGWCPYCSQEAEALAVLHQAAADKGVAFLGLVAETATGAPADAEYAAQYARKHGWQFPAAAGTLETAYWQADEDEGAVPLHVLVDLRNMRIVGRMAGMGTANVLGHVIDELAAGPQWSETGQRVVDFDCAPGGSSEQEPNASLTTAEEGTALPFDLSGVICPPTIEEGVRLDEDWVDLGHLSQGQVINVVIRPTDETSEVFPLFTLVGLVGDVGASLGYGPVDMQAVELGRQWIILGDARYLLQVGDARLVSRFFYGEDVEPPEAHSCCTGGPSFSYELAISPAVLEPTEPPVAAQQSVPGRVSRNSLAVFPFTPPAPGEYVLTMDAADPDTLDPFLVLYDPAAGEVLAFNDDRESSGSDPGRYNARIAWKGSPEQEVYLVAAYFVAVFRDGEPGYAITIEGI